MNHDAGARRQRLGRGAPRFSGRIDQHTARTRTDLPQIDPRLADARAAARALRTVPRAVAFRRAHDSVRQRFDDDAVPIGVELLGDQHRERRSNALPDLHGASADHRPAVGMDADK